MEGRGDFYWPGKQTFSGQYLNNEKHGLGKLELDDGTKYEGGFVRGLQHGGGKLWVKDGGREGEEGRWENGVRVTEE